MVLDIVSVCGGIVRVSQCVRSWRSTLACCNRVLLPGLHNKIETNTSIWLYEPGRKLDT